MRKWHPKGKPVPVGQVGKAVPVVGVLIGSGTNVWQNHLASAAVRQGARFLCDKYDLSMPTALLKFDASDEPPDSRSN